MRTGYATAGLAALIWLAWWLWPTKPPSNESARPCLAAMAALAPTMARGAIAGSQAAQDAQNVCRAASMDLSGPCNMAAIEGASAAGAIVEALDDDKPSVQAKADRAIQYYRAAAAQCKIG